MRTKQLIYVIHALATVMFVPPILVAKLVPTHIFISVQILLVCKAVLTEHVTINQFNIY